MKKILTGFLLLALSSLAAGEIMLKPLDLKGTASVYDDTEPEPGKRISIPKGKPQWAFSSGELKGFRQLREKIGDKAFNQLMAKHKFAQPKTEFDGYRGKDKLPLQYYVRPGSTTGTQLLFVVSMGEYQPTRYIAHLEGIWEIRGAAL
ncbi:MAG: hypothetical protein K8S54_09815 [Spirochaetia bacterium]|nr:hypothetical protein [Spirochaetia bacterium]